MKLREECDLKGRRTMIRSELDPTWAKLWTTDMLQIDPDDDIDEI